MSSSGNQDTEASLSPISQENAERNSGFESKIAKKDSRSACDLGVLRDSSPCNIRTLKTLYPNFENVISEIREIRNMVYLGGGFGVADGLMLALDGRDMVRVNQTTWFSYGALHHLAVCFQSKIIYLNSSIIQNCSTTY